MLKNNDAEIEKILIKEADNEMSRKSQKDIFKEIKKTLRKIDKETQKALRKW